MPQIKKEAGREPFRERSRPFRQTRSVSGAKQRASLVIPPSIRERLGDRDYSRDEIGRSGSQVFLFPDMVLKIEKSGENANNERRMLEWLEGKLPIPKILDFVSENGTNYLLMSRAEGTMCCDDYYLSRPKLLSGLLAEGMRMFWSVDIKGCPKDNSVACRLAQAKLRVEQGLCTMDGAEPETYGEGGFESPAKLWEWLNEHRPGEEFVLSHGDYCLPNVFVRDGKVSAFLDLGRCGIADRYQDIALGYRSLKHNLDGTYGGKVYPEQNPELLFAELGIKPDWEKVRYFILLDELF